jgi:hypothetical protein
MDSVAFNSGMFNSAVGGDSIVAPLGSHTANGLLDLTLLEHVALTNRKWPVHPEFIFAVSCGLSSGGGRHSSIIDLLFKLVAPEHHSVLAWLSPMVSVLVASFLCPSLGKLQLKLV